jgi:hypothetical protein
MTIRDDAICVLCGGPNSCAYAAGKSQCWCFEAEMSEEARSSSSASEPASVASAGPFRRRPSGSPKPLNC